MSGAALRSEVEEFLALEAALLDEQRWKEWLALYEPDCRFWLPAWRGDHELVDDPDTGMSFIYYQGRGGLEDRVWRAKSGMSIASTPLPRTCHQVTNVRCDPGIGSDEEDAGAPRVQVYSAWSCHVFDLRTGTQHTYFGRYAHLLLRHDSGLRIAEKKIVLANDLITGFIDFYCV